MPEWAKNRVVLGLAVFFVAVGVWQARKPRFRPMYEQGIVFYQHGRYLEALREFDRAYAIAPNEVEVIVMVGWSNLKLRRYEEAGFYFQRAHRIQPRNREAQVGTALVEWHTGRLDEEKVRQLAARYPDDPDVAALLAAVERRRAP